MDDELSIGGRLGRFEVYRSLPVVMACRVVAVANLVAYGEAVVTGSPLPMLYKE